MYCICVIDEPEIEPREERGHSNGRLEQRVQIGMTRNAHGIGIRLFITFTYGVEGFAEESDTI